MIGSLLRRDATLMVQTAPEEAYRKFDDLSRKHIDSLRALTKNIQDARLAYATHGHS